MRGDGGIETVEGIIFQICLDQYDTLLKDEIV